MRTHVLLERPDLQRAVALRGERQDERAHGIERRQTRDATLDAACRMRKPSDCADDVAEALLITRSTPPSPMRSKTCGEPSAILFTRVVGTPCSLKNVQVPGVAKSSKSISPKARATDNAAAFSSSAIDNRMRPPGGGGARPLPMSPRSNASAYVAPDPEHFAGRFHFRPEHRLDAAQLREREHRHFRPRRNRARTKPGPRPHIAQRLAERDARRGRDERHAGELRDDRHGAARARIGLDDVQLALVDNVLDVDQPADPKFVRRALGDVGDARLPSLRRCLRRVDGHRVARVDAGALDVLEDARDEMSSPS